MERRWPAEAIDFGVAVRGALARHGGVDLARRCELDPGKRGTEVRGLLGALGLLELDPRAGEAEAAAAALALRAAGEVVCPWPLAEQLTVPVGLRDRLEMLVLVDGPVRRAAHLDLAPRAVAVDVDTREPHRLRVVDPVVWPMPLDPFGVRCESGQELPSSELEDAVDVAVLLNAFWVVGALGAARDLAARHARDRRQFGRRIVDFGGIQWHLSEITVAHDSLWELASFSLARFIAGHVAPVDTLALLVTTLDSAHAVLDHAHQVLAATGLCEEHDLAVLDRHLQHVLRRPCGMHRAVGLLADEIARSGFDNLYPIQAAVPA